MKNESIKYKHFKMESIQHFIDCIQPNMYMASVDLKDAYYSIPIAKDHEKYLKFVFNNNIYYFKALPNGYGPAMRIFTKVLKIPFSHLRKLGHLSVVYVDDTLLLRVSIGECSNNVTDTVET